MFDVLKNGNSARLFGIILHVKQGLSHCRILQKRVNSDKKQSARTERSINIGKKTIQVSNFHNAAETDVNLTGRKQILIQSGCCLFFLTGKRHIIFGNIFKPYLVRFNFSKKRKRFFLLKKILNETRYLPFRFPKAEKFFILRATERKKSPYTFYRKVIGAENGIYSKGVKSVDTRTKFPYN